ncbi:MAG TPA: hypothetical protein VFH29_07905 [Anaerolineales bacterium]|nr:hypothetical protein [Anaerolineales bacterium]
MSTTVLSADTTVAAALEANPAIRSVFVARRTACLGCYLARFCTLRDSAQYYGLPLMAFVEELALAGAENAISKGEAHA